MPSTFNYTLSNAGRVDRLLNIIDNRFYFGFAKSTPWSTNDSTINDLNPPTPDVELSNIGEVFLYKRALKVQPVVASGCGEIPFNSCSDVIVNGNKWTPIDVSNNPRELLNILVPRHIYFSVVITPTEFTFSSFRILGLYANPTFATNIPTNRIKYLNSEFTNPGTLYWSAYFSPIISTPEKLTQIDIVISV